LSHALSNHPDVFCVRDEAMHGRSVWRQNVELSENVLNLMWGQHHYAVSMGKLTYTQAWHDAVFPLLKRCNPAVIWLYRENVIRQAVSLVLVKLYHKGLAQQPVHSIQETPLMRVELEPGVILDHARSLTRANDRARERLKGFKRVLEVTYTDVVGSEQGAADYLPTKTGQRICAFLDVPYQRLGCHLKKVNPYPLATLLSNWSAVEKAIRGSEFAELLEDEWTS
jgi:hypothetical protein